MRSELDKINQENRKIDMFRMVAAFFHRGNPYSAL